MDEAETDLIEVDDSTTDFVWTLCTDFVDETDFVADVTFMDCSTRLLDESLTERRQDHSVCARLEDPRWGSGFMVFICATF